MRPHIHSTEPALGANQLNDVESRLGLKLPPSYRAFLLRHNGGQPTPDKFVPEDHASPEVLAWFMAVNDRDDGLVALARSYRPHLHRDLLPIASDPFGNLICLGVQGDHTGQVFFWLHEGGLPPQTPLPNEDCRCVAASFNAFMASFVKAA